MIIWPVRGADARKAIAKDVKVHNTLRLDSFKHVFFFKFGTAVAFCYNFLHFYIFLRCTSNAHSCKKM